LTEAALFFVYVLRNAYGIFYTGIAKDVDARLRQHNAGCGARFTRGRGPWTICHREGPLAHGDALRREAAIKIDRKFKAALRVRLAELTKTSKRKPARPRSARLSK
jgi:putative endonuclease